MNSMAKPAPNSGIRLVNSPARPGPISSTARMKKICDSSDGKTATKASASQPFQVGQKKPPAATRSEEHTSELQSLMRISYAVFCLKKKKRKHNNIDKFVQMSIYINT